MQCLACGLENGAGITACEGCGSPLDRVTAERLIGTTVGGRFRITKVLGEGGMGVVYEAEQVLGSTVRKVAVKMLHPHLSSDRSITARFHRECGTVAQLEHPNTIRVFDFGRTDDGALYIAMEYVRGRPLADVIEAGPMPPERVLHVMTQVCSALTEAHSLGVVHRDLKPDNVLLSNRAGEEDFAKVLDFGIAHTQATAPGEQKLTKQGMVLGTPPYMSPEQFGGQPLDARSDVYSLGVMAYEMLTGRLPFSANTPWEWASKHLTEPPAPFDASTIGGLAPDAMKQAIMRALTKDRGGRPSSTKQFAAELAGSGARLAAAAVPILAPSFRTEVMPGASDPGMAAPVGTPSPGGTQVATPASGGTQVAAPFTPASGRPRTGPGVAVAAPAPAIAPPPRRKKGLIYGLSALGGVLGVALIILVAQGMRSGGGDSSPTDFRSNGSPGLDGDGDGAPATELLAMVDTEAAAGAGFGGDRAAPEPTKRPTKTPGTKRQPTTPTPEAPEPEAPEPEAPKPEAPKPEAPKPKPGTISPGLPAGLQIPKVPFPISFPNPTTPTPNPTTPTPQPPTPQPPTPQPPADPCAKCVDAVRSGDFVSAGNNFGLCSKREGRRQCRSAARTEAPKAAARAADAGRCAEAKAIAYAARAMGADSKVLQRISQKCK